jgi:hypothetical protein
MRQANPNFAGVGDDPGTSTTGTNGGFTPPRTNIDLTPVSFGQTTFTNPCFWIIIGAVGAVALYYFLNKQK